jgi:photosystem II biogenesis protein Psp29
VVEELMVEMHLLSVNADFRYDSIYALGVVTAFDRFMQGYRPEKDKDSIFNALCRSLESDPQAYRQDAERVKAEVANISIDELLAKVQNLQEGETNGVFSTFKKIAETPHFKYSRLFAIGLYTLLETIDDSSVVDEEQRNSLLETLCCALNLPQEKLPKDLDLYRSNLEKITQAQSVLDDVLKADRKKREQRAQEKAKQVVAAPPEEPQEPT